MFHSYKKCLLNPMPGEFLHSVTVDVFLLTHFFKANISEVKYARNFWGPSCFYSALTSRDSSLPNGHSHLPQR